MQEADKCFVVDFKAKISTIREVDPTEVDITQFYINNGLILMLLTLTKYNIALFVSSVLFHKL